LPWRRIAANNPQQGRLSPTGTGYTKARFHGTRSTGYLENSPVPSRQRSVLVEAFFLADQPEHVSGATDHRCYDTARGLGRFPGLRATCVPCMSFCIMHRRVPIQCSSAHHCVLVHVKSICFCAITRSFLASINSTSSKPFVQVHDVVDNFDALLTGASTFSAKFVNTADMLRDGEDGIVAHLPDGAVLPSQTQVVTASGSNHPTDSLSSFSPDLVISTRPPAFHVMPHYHINDEGILATPKPKPTLVTWVGYAPLEPTTRARIETMLEENHPGVELRRHKFNSRDKAAAMRELAESDAVLVWDQCYRTPRGAPSDPIWHYQCSRWKPGGRLTYAMSLGLPVLAHSMYSANREVVKRCPTPSAAELFLADEDSVVGKLDSLLKNFTLRQELSAASVETSRDYSRPKILRRYRRFLTDKALLVAEGQRSGPTPRNAARHT